MLNDWSDRPPPRRKGFVRSVEFAAGVFVAFAALGLLAGVVAWVRG